MFGLGFDNYSLSNCHRMFSTGTVLIITIITNNIIITTAITVSTMSTMFANPLGSDIQIHVSRGTRLFKPCQPCSPAGRTSPASGGHPGKAGARHLEVRLCPSATFRTIIICILYHNVLLNLLILTSMIITQGSSRLSDPYSISFSIHSINVQNWIWLMIAQSSPRLSDPHSSSSFASSSAQVIFWASLIFIGALKEVIIYLSFRLNHMS